MTLVSWPSAVNQKFFSFNQKPKDNTIVNEYISGRIVGYQKNTKAIMQINCSLSLSIENEEAEFWEWFNNTLGALSGAFTCAALGTKNYRFTSIPEPADTDRLNRVLNLEIEEVY